MLNGNIFKEAKRLWKAKPISEMTEEEVVTFKAAMILVNLLPEYQGIPILDGLESLANIWDGKEDERWEQLMNIGARFVKRSWIRRGTNT